MKKIILASESFRKKDFLKKELILVKLQMKKYPKFNT